MKRIIFIPFLLLILTGSKAQTPGIDQVLKSIEANNKDLQANAQLTSSRKLEAKTGNNLPDPRFSYAYLWGSEKATISEMVVSQSFDFPTLYASRNQLNKLKTSAFDSQAETFRCNLLLQAKVICLDIIMLRQQKQILDERLDNARKLSALYTEKLEKGEANIIETNKINLELLNVRTEANLNETSLQNKIQELNALNGSTPINFDETVYPLIAFPTDFEQLRNEILASDYELRTLHKESEAAGKEVSINKAQWLPKLELGYRRNTESNRPFNGMVVGLSIPLFENRSKVKMAKAQSLSLEYQKENAALQIESKLTQLYKEARTLRNSMEEYEKTFTAQSDLKVLKEALTGGEISMIEYFVEVSMVYQSKLNYIQLQNQYQKVMAEIHKNRL